MILLGDAFGNVLVKPTKSVLALSGIAMGTAAVIALLHIGAIARDEGVRSFEVLGANFLTIQAPVGGHDRAQITAEDVSAIPLDWVGLADAAPMVRGSTLVFEGHNQIPVSVLGTTPNAQSLLRLSVEAGRFVSTIDGFEPFAVLGADVANEVSQARGHPLALGEKVHIGEEIFRVIGVLGPQAMNPLNGLEPNKLVVVNMKAARRLIREATIDSVAARLAPGRSAAQVAAAVGSYFKLRLKGAEVQLLLASDLIAGIGQQMQIYDTLLLAIGGISLSIGGIGIMNVMLMAVMERKEEVGLRMAVGASPRSITLMFLMESIALSGVGSALGLILGVSAAWVFALHSGWQFAFTPQAVPLGIGMALFVGLFFGIYPARRAAALHPVVALRRE